MKTNLFDFNKLPSVGPQNPTLVGAAINIAGSLAIDSARRLIVPWEMLRVSVEQRERGS